MLSVNDHSITTSNVMQRRTVKISKAVLTFAFLICILIGGLCGLVWGDTAWQIIQVREGDSIVEYQLVPEQLGDSIVLARHHVERIKLHPVNPKIGNYSPRPFELDSATIAATSLNVNTTLEPVPRKPGPATVKIRVWWGERAITADTAQFRLGFVNLPGNKSEIRTISFGPKHEWDTTFDISIRSLDTCGITVTIIAPNNMGVDDLYLVASPDSIATYHGDPRVKPMRLISPAITKSERINGMLIDSLPPVKPLLRVDTVSAKGVTLADLAKPGQDPRIITSSSMAVLEQYPLTETDVQTILVDTQYYERSRGEHKFHPVLTIRDIEAYTRRIADSIFELTADSVIEIWLDLRTVADTNGIGALVDSLVATDTSGIYRSHATGRRLRLLRDRGVPCDSWPRPR